MSDRTEIQSEIDALAARDGETKTIKPSVLAASPWQVMLDRAILRDELGWALYNGDDYTSVSPLVISQGATTRLLNNGGALQLIDQLPTGEILYDTASDLIVAGASKDAMIARIGFKAYTSSNNGGFTVSLDISAAHDGSITIASQPVRMIRGTGAGNVQTYIVSIPLYALDTFIANGCAVFLTSETGTTTIYDVTYFIQKTYAAR